MNVCSGRSFRLLVAGLALALLPFPASADTTAQTVPYSQNWSNNGQITATDNWSGVPGVEGFLGQDITTGTAVDPQTLTAGASSVANDLTVLPNLTVSTSTAGDVAEFHSTSQATPTNGDSVVGLQGSGTADAPHIIITLTTTGKTNINVAYNLRDVDCGADNAVQPVALQYRTATSGTFTNVAAAYVADATTGPSICTQVTAVSATLPAAADNQSVLQLRIMTTNASGSDEWVGIDDISVTTVATDVAPTVTGTTPADNALNVAVNSNISVTFSEQVVFGGGSINCTISGNHTNALLGGNPGTTFGLDPDVDFVNAETCTVTIPASAVADTDGIAPANMAADYVFDFQTVGAPTDPSLAGTATPGTARPTETTTLEVVVTPGTNPTSATYVVEADLSPIGGSTAQPLYDDGSNGDQVASDLTYTYVATVAVGTTPGSKTLVVSVEDDQNRTGSTSLSFTVAPPALAIHDVQGDGSTSPYVGQVVEITGVVTARKFNNGFFVQTPDADVDGDPDTSEGIFVFTSSAPPSSAAVGNIVTVQGTVVEFVPSQDPTQVPMTEMTLVTVTQVSTGNPLPAPIVLTAADTPAGAPMDVLERFEGMRVSIPSLVVTAPTGGSGAAPKYLSSFSNGVFQGVIRGAAIPFREAGIDVHEVVPPAAGVNTLRFDGNSQRIRVDSDGQIGVTTKVEVAVGNIVQGLVGPLDYGFRTWSVLPDATPTVVGVPAANVLRNQQSDEFTVGAYNMQRFYDDVDDPALSSGNEPVMTRPEFEQRLGKASMAIRLNMKTPDIVGIIEIEGLNALRELADRVNADAVAAGRPNPFYVPYLYEGNDIGGIDVGYLVKAARAFVYSVEQLGADFLWNDPSNGMTTLNDRPPLMLRAGLLKPGGGVQKLTVIVVHQRSLGSIDDPGAAGDRTRTKRRQQSEYLAGQMQSIQLERPSEPVVVIGDFNAFEMNDGYVDVMGILTGEPAPADQVTEVGADILNPNFVNLVTKISPYERASYSFDGNLQVLDHVLVSANVYNRVRSLSFAHVNAYMPESLRADATRPERLSDHELPVVSIRYGAPLLPAAPVAMSPGVPQPLPPAVIQDTTPTLVWGESLRATSYRVVIVNAAGNVVFSRQIPASACSRGFCQVTTPVMRTGVNLAVKVRAFNNLGGSTFSAPIRFKIVP